MVVPRSIRKAMSMAVIFALGILYVVLLTVGTVGRTLWRHLARFRSTRRSPGPPSPSSR